MADDDRSKELWRSSSQLESLRPPIEAEELAEMLAEKPIGISDEDTLDHVKFFQFEQVGSLQPSLEMGFRWIPEKDGFYFYYEVIDFDGYREGDVIAVDSPRRLDVIYEYPKTREDYEKLAAKVNQSLKTLDKMYLRNV